ncbi:MAG: hypothetical protein NZ480_00345 [Bdellovibrionaceae bacterium]|nr:hypothetical protein [Pseudobdellovibrionaceae bacterium]MDW8190144.1 hypothetical protein [Pseudobdellovibrionaceae bacterium]
MSYYYQDPHFFWCESIEELKTRIETSDFVIYDQRLSCDIDCLKSDRSPNLFFAIQGGEFLKDLHQCYPIFNVLMQNPHLPPKPRFIAIGGGSITDTVGFIAAIYKRGCPLVFVPSTWLAAIDAAHGGKNALNYAGLKNMLGTFYFPNEIWFCRALFERLPSEQAEDAWAEALKVALIDSHSLYKKMCQTVQSSSSCQDGHTQKTPCIDLWPLLPDLIEAKYKIVRQDPYDEKKIRYRLNLGHTLGHIIESQRQLSHGRAVGYGLRFAYEFSKFENVLETELWLPGIPSLAELQQLLPQLNNLAHFLKHDKKHTKGIEFVFIQRPGQIVTRSISIDQITSFIKYLSHG